MKKVKGLALAALMLASSTVAVNAQDKVEANVSADVVSNYIWRGQNLGGISVQPTLGLSYKGLSLTAWGSVGLNGPTAGSTYDNRELDLTLAYSIGGFNIGVTDYWFQEAGQDAKKRYFMYKAHDTNHVFEVNVGYDFGPVAIQWFTNFAGNDFKTNDNGESKHAYSSYVELSAPFKLGGLDWVAAVGAVPFTSSSVYEGTSVDGGVKDFAVTNISVKATKDINITPSFSVPLFAQVMANPCTQKAYFAVGFTLHP